MMTSCADSAELLSVGSRRTCNRPVCHLKISRVIPLPGTKRTKLRLCNQHQAQGTARSRYTRLSRFPPDLVEWWVDRQAIERGSSAGVMEEKREVFKVVHMPVTFDTRLFSPSLAASLRGIRQSRPPPAAAAASSHVCESVYKHNS